MPRQSTVGGFDLLGLIYVALVVAAILLPMMLGRRAKPPDSDEPGSDEGRGRGPRRPHDPPPPSLPPSVPLPDAEPSRTRMRDHAASGRRARARRARREHPPPERRPDRVPSGYTSSGYGFVSLDG